jgi:hypothetical protein
VAAFLTDQWFDDLEAAARGTSVPLDVRLVIQQIIPGSAEGDEVAYVLSAADGAITVRRGRAEAPDITFTQDRATAEAIHRGELSAQAAFIEGRLRLGGDLRAVIERADSLISLDDVFAAARA